MAIAAARMGKTADARRLLGELETGKLHVSAAQLAAIYGALGDIRRGIAELERSYRNHEAFLISIKVHPDLDPFRGEARFRAIQKNMGLE